jgi:reactive intermediate/imine deaminase
MAELAKHSFASSGVRGSMSNLFRRGSLVVLGLLVVAFGSKLTAQDRASSAIVPVAGKATGAYRPGILANGTLYISGQGGRNSDGSLAGDFQQQAGQSLRNVQSILHESGMDFGNVVWMNIYLTNTHDLDAMNGVYWKSIGPHPPARTVLVVGALPDGGEVEINCIAVGDTSRRRSIWPQGWPQGQHADPPAIQADDVLYLSAQGGTDPRTGKAAADFRGEVKQALDNVAVILKTANLSLKNVVWVNPYLSVGSQYDVMGSVYKTYFEFGNTPGRGTIEVMGLPNDNHVVFSCIAGADLGKRKAVRPRNMPPSATASPGVLYGDTLYLSAKDGFIPDQGIVTPDFELQLRQSMRNLLDGLEEADMGFADVVFSTVYLRQIQDSDRMNNLYGKFFKDKSPARTVLQQNVDGKTEAAEQISFIAVRQKH